MKAFCSDRTAIILLASSKPVALDDYLPFCLAVKARHQDARFFLAFYNRQALEFYGRHRSTVRLAEREIGIEVLGSFRPGRFRVLLMMARILWIVARHRRTIMIKAWDVVSNPRPFMWLARRFGNVTEVLFRYDAYTASVRANRRDGGRRITEARTGKSPRKNPRYDLMLGRGDDPELRPDLRVGYLKGLPEYRQWVLANSLSFPQPYCVFVCGYLGLRRKVWDERGGLVHLQEVLPVLERFNRELFVVFKPHAITDTDTLEVEIARAGLSRFTIVHEPPAVLLTGASLALSCIFSTVQCDARFLGVPTCDYYTYDEELYRACENWSFGGDCVSHHYRLGQQDRLAELLSGVVDGSVKDYNITMPQTSRSFWADWADVMEGRKPCR